jgi:hypothetical protein
MRIEIVANKLSDTDAETGQAYRLGKGDVVTVPDAYGAKLCARGWATDVEGKVPSAPFTPGAAKLTVQKAVVAAKGA